MMNVWHHKLFSLTIAFFLLGLSVTAQIPKHFRRNLKTAYPIDLQRHLFTTIKYPDKAERSYVQGNTVAYFTVNDRKITLLSIAPKLTIEFKNEIIKAFKGYETNNLKDGHYGMPIHFRIHNVVTRIINPEVTVHSSYIDLPELEIYIGRYSCDPGTPHFYCEPNTLHEHYHLQPPPEYPGGFKTFVQFLNSQIKYPRAALKAQVQGDVYVSFVIEKDGNLSSLKVERSLGYGTDEEAIRVLKLSQKWKPGFEKGKPIRTIIRRLSIKFIPEHPFKNPKPIRIYLKKNLKNPPQYPGGEERLAEFIKSNINYSNLANKRVKGAVIVRAVVEMNGSLTQLEVIDNLGYGTKREALRVVSKLKRWYPGMENGIPTRTLVTIPVKFNP